MSNKNDKSKKYYIETNVLLTPKLATKLLESMKHNRDISQITVDNYAKQMKNGEWREHIGSTMVVDTNKEFRDGQHRAWGVFYSGISIRVDIAYNVKPEDVQAIDTGARRTGTDTLVMESKIDGHPLKNASAISSSIIIINAWDERGNIYAIRGKKAGMTNIEIHRFFKANPGIEDSAEYVCGKKALVSGTIMTALHYILSRTKSNKTKVDEFFTKFITGEDLYAGDPILLLRNKMIQHKSNPRATMSRTFVLSCVLKAWHAHAKGKALKSLIFNSESLPQPNRRYKKRAITKAEKK